MAVPTSLASLSTTPGSNPPSGAENPFPELDDHLRQMYAFSAQLRDQKAPLNNPTFTGIATAPRFSIDSFSMYVSGGAAIINFDPNDYIQFIRSTNVVDVVVGGSSRLTVGSSGPERPDDATTANGLVRKSQLDSAVSAAFAAGDTKYSYQTADHGRWLLVTGPQRTIGNAGSGATARANADTLALYTLLWSLDAADVAIYTSTGAASTRGASAAADFAALKRIDLPNESGLVSKGHHGGNGDLTTNTARRLASVEYDEVKAHSHTYDRPYIAGGSQGTGPNQSLTPIAGGSLTGSTGGAENLVRNRSKNAFIYF